MTYIEYEISSLIVATTIMIIFSLQPNKLKRIIWVRYWHGTVVLSEMSWNFTNVEIKFHADQATVRFYLKRIFRLKSFVK